MTILFYTALLLAGFGFLIKGADWLVESSSSLAVRLSITPIVIGLTIVAFGTSLPELTVNFFAALDGSASICFGNIIGSNIVNIFLILGIAALIQPLSCKNNTVWKEIPFSLIGVLALFFLCNDKLLGSHSSELSRGDGLVLLLFFSIFITYIFAISKVETDENINFPQSPTWKIITFILIGLVALLLGGKLVIKGAVFFARILQFSERTIGLTIVAIGTSLPELITSAVAARKNQMDIAIGNIVGSNIFNIFFILAISAVIRPLPFDLTINSDLFVLFAATFLLFLTMFTGKKRILERWEAITFLVLYAGYTFYLLVF